MKRFDEEKPDDFVYRLKGDELSALRRIEIEEYPEENKYYLKEFREYLKSEKIGEHRRISHLVKLNKIFRLWLPKPVTEVTKRDMRSLMGTINNLNQSAWSKYDFKRSVKAFWTFLEDEEEIQGAKEVVEKIKPKQPKTGSKLPKDLITRDELNAMLDVVSGFRDRAMIYFLYDSGCRIGELLRMQIKDIEFDKYGATVMLDGKKEDGQEANDRSVTVIESVRHLKNWLEFHPDKHNRDAYVWVKVGQPGIGKPMNYQTATKQLKKIVKRAGLNKRVHAHLFRHSRATELSNYLPEGLLCKQFGWKEGSDMPSIYIHLCGKDTKNAMYKLYGLQSEDDDTFSLLKPVKCPVCDAANPQDALFCNNCGNALQRDSANKMLAKEFNKTEDDAMDEMYSLFAEFVKQYPEVLKKMKAQASSEQ